MYLLAPIYDFFLDLFKGGISIGNLNIANQDIAYFLSKTFLIICTILVMYLTIKIGSAIINKSVEKQKKMKFSLDIKKAKTIGAVLKSLLRYTVYFFGVVYILTQLFGNISLTFAGIGGVAIGFGAQSLIKDIINGFFILFEDQFAVGDYVEIESKSGIIESIELRITKIRGFNGDLHIIPNGLITKVTNHSRGDISITVTVDVAYEEDIDKTIEVIEKVCDIYKKENSNIVDGPNVVGITDLKENSYTVKIVGKVKQMTQWDSENKLRMEIKRGLDKAKIRTSYSKIQIVKEG